jgi:hypothetical protein
LEESTELFESLPHTWNRKHDGGAEWTGELLSDDKNTSTLAPIAFPWLKRRRNGYWFNMDEEPAEESQIEHISDYTARTVTKDVRRRARHSVIPDARNGYQRLL